MNDPAPPHDSGITRREAVLRISSAAAAAVAVGAGTLALLDRRPAGAVTPPGIPDWRLPASGEALRTVAVHGADPGANLRRALAAFGGIEHFVRRGERVLLKPNVGWDRLPEQAANTDPRLLAELVRLCLAAGAAKVVVADISCNDPVRCFDRSGIRAAARAAGAEVLDGRTVKLVPASVGGAAAGLEVIAPLFEVERVINVPIAKHHSLSRVTVGMKNWFGVFGRGRNRLHQDIQRTVAELGAIFRPTLTVVDAGRVLLDNGPQGGSLDDVKELHALAVGTDPVACDAWGAARIGADPRTLPFLAEAERRGLGSRDLARIQDLGSA